MGRAGDLIGAGLKTPKVAAIAGVIFSLLTLTSFGLLWMAIPADPEASSAWLASSASSVKVALNLLPFAGIIVRPMTCVETRV